MAKQLEKEKEKGKGKIQQRLPLVVLKIIIEQWAEDETVPTEIIKLMAEFTGEDLKSYWVSGVLRDWSIFTGVLGPVHFKFSV